MSGPNATEAKLLDISKQFDAALSDCNAGNLKSLLSTEVVLHQGEQCCHLRDETCTLSFFQYMNVDAPNPSLTFVYPIDENFL